MNGSAISVVLPVYKNESSLRDLFKRLKRVLDSTYSFYEIVFVNDASPDSCSSILQGLSKEDPCVKIITFSENKGQNRAILEGIEQSKGDIIVIMDADLQDPPEMIPSIVSKVKEGYGAVFAARKGNYESYFRLLTSKMFKYLIHKLCNLPKDAGLFVAIDRSIAVSLKKIFMPTPFVVAMIGLTGCKTFSISFIRKKQRDNKTSYTFLMRLKIALFALYSVIRLRKMMKYSEQQKAYYAKANHFNIFPGNYPKHIERVLVKAIDHLSLKENILEVGCGMGRFTIPLAQKNFRIEGLDLSPDLIERMKSFKSIPLHCEDLLNLPKHLLGKYDVVIGFFILHHLPDLEKAFRSLSLLLKPTGKIIFIEPNPYNLLYYLQILLHTKMCWKEERNILKMRPSSLKISMKGFSEFKLKRFGFFPPFIYEKNAKLEKILEKMPFFSPFLPYQILSAKKT